MLASGYKVGLGQLDLGNVRWERLHAGAFGNSAECGGGRARSWHKEF
jgi:hypothetical protein